MKLESKKNLAARALKVGRKRIIFNIQRLAELKEAITKQDIKDLKESGVISLKEKKGTRKIKRRKTRRRAGSVKLKVKTTKQDYVIMTRKLRAYLANLKKRGQIENDKFIELRKEIRTKNFRSLSHMKERMKLTKSERSQSAKNTKKTKKRRKN